MGIPVTRIEKEFIFKSLKARETIVSIYGKNWELQSRIIVYDDLELKMEILEGRVTLCGINDESHVFFSFQNINFTFKSKVREHSGNLLVLKQPEKMYKDSVRGYRRIKMDDTMSLSFLLKHQRYDLNFPKRQTPISGILPELSNNFNPSSIAELINSFKKKMSKSVSEYKIHMLRSRNIHSIEEHLMINSCKIIWLPFIEKDLPVYNPFPGNNILLKDDFIKYQESRDIPMYKIEKLIQDFLFQKKIKGIHSEVFCPLFHENYFVGYIYACNKDDMKWKISKDLIDYIDQFSKVLSYSLKENGYYKKELKEIETSFEAPIIDISASGLLFAYTSNDLNKELDIFKEVNFNLSVNNKSLFLDSRIIRKFKNQKRYYIGAQFRKIEPDDFCYLYEYLYKKPFIPLGKYVW